MKIDKVWWNTLSNRWKLLKTLTHIDEHWWKLMTIDETDVAIDENWWKLMKSNNTLTTIDENWWT